MMHALSAQDILRIWESDLGQHPIDQALAILAVAFPNIARNTLAALSIGQRDTCLLAIRERTFGSQLSAFASCPQCQEQVESVLNLAEMQLAPVMEAVQEEQQMIIEGDTNQGLTGAEIQVRLPNSFDLAAIAHCVDSAAAGRLLAQRCITQASRDGQLLPPDSLPESLITAVAEYIAERDPMAEIRLELLCPACGHEWQMVFDITTFLWREISARAKRVLQEVHILAQAYGWSEADILSMSAARRQVYREMVS